MATKIINIRIKINNISNSYKETIESIQAELNSNDGVESYKIKENEK